MLVTALQFHEGWMERLEAFKHNEWRGGPVVLESPDNRGI